MTREEIALILKDLRMRSGLTQKDAAEKLGRKQQTLASWETGQSQPDANTLFVLCSIYGVSIDEAFGFNNQKAKIGTKHDELINIFNSLDKDLQDYALKQIKMLLELQGNKAKESE